MKRLMWVALALLASCSKCGSKASAVAPVERVIPSGCVGAVMLPSVDALGARLRLLEHLKVASFLAPTQGFSDSKAFADALVSQLGIDVRNHAALEAAGVDGARSAAAFALVSGQVVAALPVSDRSKFDATVSKLAARRFGASVAETRTENGAEVRVFSVPNGPARVGYAVAHGFALVAADDGVARLSALITLSSGDSLNENNELRTRRARLPRPGDVQLYLPLGSPLLAKAPFTTVLASASLDSKGFELHADAVPKAERSDVKVFESKPADDLTAYLPRDAFLVARYQGDPRSLAPVLPWFLGPHLARAFAKHGIDLGPDVLERLKPGQSVSLSLAERPPLGQGMPAIDLRLTNPFTFVHLAGVAVAASSEGVLPTVEKVAAAAPSFGAEMKRSEREGVTTFITSYSQGEGVHLAVKGDHLFFGSPIQRVDALSHHDPFANSPVDGLEAEPLALVLDLQRLSQSVRQLPESAWGLGGFAMKATSIRWLDAVDDLRSVSLSAGLHDGSVHVHARLALTLPDTTGASAP